MRFFVLFIILFPIHYLCSQVVPISFNWPEKQRVDYLYQKTDSFSHDGYLPLCQNNSCYDSIIDNTILKINYTKGKYFGNFSHHSIVQVKENDFLLHINPILNETYSNNSENYYSQNTRGILISGQFDKHFRFVSTMIETQAFYLDYIDKYKQLNSVIPGSGRARGFKTNGYDFSQSSGYINYQATKSLQFLLGHTRQFIGYGYRSVLLSDAPLDYPIFRAAYAYKRFQYSAGYAVFQSASAFDDRTKVYSRKYSSQHLLSYIIIPQWEMGIFENTIFNAMSLNNNRPPEEFYSPIIFSHLFTYGLHGNKNVMIGVQTQICLLPKLKIYGQLAVDDLKIKNDSLSDNKTAWQCGIKINEPFKIKNLFILAEYNYASNGIYVGTSDKETFSQHNEPIAHILGNNFSEKNLMLHYQWKRLFLYVKINDAQYGTDAKRLSFIYSSQNRSIENLSHVFQYKIETGFVVHSPSRMQLVIGLQQRKEIIRENYIYLSLRTTFGNFYDDF